MVLRRRRRNPVCGWVTQCRLAEAIAAELGVEALPLSEPIKEYVDVLLLGNSYYAFSIDPEAVYS